MHLLTYYARKYRQEVSSLVLANCARAEGYPFAAAAINVGHMLVKMLVHGLAPEEEVLLCALRRADAPSLPSSPTVLLRSPLFVVMSRIVEDSRDRGGGQGDGGAGGATDGDSSRDFLGLGEESCGWVLEEMFCAAFGLLEQVCVLRAYLNAVLRACLAFTSLACCQSCHYPPCAQGSLDTCIPAYLHTTYSTHIYHHPPCAQCYLVTKTPRCLL